MFTNTGESLPPSNQNITDSDEEDGVENNLRYTRPPTYQGTDRGQLNPETQTSNTFQNSKQESTSNSEDNSEYSVIRIQDVILSTTSSVQALSDIAEASDKEEEENEVVRDSVYSVITREQMDNYSEAESEEDIISTASARSRSLSPPVITDLP